MAISIDWKTKVIFVPKADLTLVQSSPTEIREMNLNWFRLQLKNMEDSEEGIVADDTHRHNTELSLGGMTFARAIEMINDYTITFEDGQYAVNLVGANSNVADKTNVNQVSVRSNNSAGLIVYSSGSSSVWDEPKGLNVTAKLEDINQNVEDIHSKLPSGMLAEYGEYNGMLMRALGLLQENQYMDQVSYVDFNGQKLLSSMRIRTYSDSVSVGTDSNVIATYKVTTSWNSEEMTSYKVERL